MNNDEGYNYREKDSTSKVHSRDIVFPHLLLGYHYLFCLLEIAASK